MIAVSTPLAAQDVTGIRYVTADEAYTLMCTELNRFLVLVNKLDSEDWGKPTACSEWNVRDILAHQAGSYASGTSYKEMFRQVSNKPAPGQLIEDAINAFQLKERAGNSPAELIAELQEVGPIGAKKWAYNFRFAKLFSLPHPVAGKLPIRHLIWVIHIIKQKL